MSESSSYGGYDDDFEHLDTAEGQHDEDPPAQDPPIEDPPIEDAPPDLTSAEHAGEGEGDGEEDEYSEKGSSTAEDPTPTEEKRLPAGGAYDAAAGGDSMPEHTATQPPAAPPVPAPAAAPDGAPAPKEAVHTADQPPNAAPDPVPEAPRNIPAGQPPQKEPTPDAALPPAQAPRAPIPEVAPAVKEEVPVAYQPPKKAPTPTAAFDPVSLTPPPSAPLEPLPVPLLSRRSSRGRESLFRLLPSAGSARMPPPPSQAEDPLTEPLLGPSSGGAPSFKVPSFPPAPASSEHGSLRVPRFVPVWPEGKVPVVRQRLQPERDQSGRLLPVSSPSRRGPLSGRPALSGAWALPSGTHKSLLARPASKGPTEPPSPPPLPILPVKRPTGFLAPSNVEL
eukprot:Hpha_TRINITY_DN16191_c7_g2::TRINITY_DN16191_c7_g2_i2::g.4985::m.4985